MSEIGRVIAHKTTHQAAGVDEINATGLAGRCNFVDRGDPAAADFTQATLVTNNTWQDLGLSAIVPAGAIAVLLHIYVQDDAVSSTLEFRKKGLVNAVNASVVITQISTVTIGYDIVVFLDANRVLQYRGSNLSFASIGLTVGGWWI